MSPLEIRAYADAANLPLELNKRWPEYQRPGAIWTASLKGIGSFVHTCSCTFAEGGTPDEAVTNLAELLSHRLVIVWGERRQMPGFYADPLPDELKADPEITEGESVFRQILADHRGIDLNNLNR